MNDGMSDGAGTLGYRLTGRRLAGLEIRVATSHKDARGAFTEVFSEDWGLGIDPAQWSVVQSEPRVLRGMHLHLRHDEYFCCLAGRAVVGLHDLRPGSPTEGAGCLIELGADPLVLVVFPRGLVHGWYFPERAVHLQAVSETYASYGADDNLRCNWADPGLGFDWPDPEPLVSGLASEAGSLADLARRVAGAEGVTPRP